MIWNVNSSCRQVNCSCQNLLGLTLSQNRTLDYGPFQYPDYPTGYWPFDKNRDSNSICQNCSTQNNNYSNITFIGNITTTYLISYRPVNISIIGNLGINGILSLPFGSLLTISGCADLSNTTFVSNYTNNSTYTIIIALNNCSNLHIKDIQIKNLPNCTNYIPRITAGIFSISFENSCSDLSNDQSPQVGAISKELIGIAVGIIVLLAIVITIALYFSPLKKIIFPYRSRRPEYILNE